MQIRNIYASFDLADHFNYGDSIHQSILDMQHTIPISKVQLFGNTSCKFCIINDFIVCCY